jgi:HD-like signal output (HDOD) protein
MNQQPLASVIESSKLGSLPGAYAQLSKVLLDPSASREEVARAVGLDPGLVARLLKLVNAPGFARRQIETVSHACLYLGRGQLRELALATTVVHMFRGLPENVVDMKSFWTHSVAVGLLAETLAKQVRFYGDESLFVSGLLHDIGTLTLATARPPAMRIALMEAGNSKGALSESERHVLGYDHAQVGDRLLSGWNLPSLHVEVARRHHDLDDNCLRRAMARPIALCHVADVIVCGLRWGSAGERWALPIDDRAWEVSGLTIPMLDQAVDEVESRLEQVVQALL